MIMSLLTENMVDFATGDDESVTRTSRLQYSHLCSINLTSAFAALSNTRVTGTGSTHRPSVLEFSYRSSKFALFIGFRARGQEDRQLPSSLREFIIYVTERVSEMQL